MRVTRVTRVFARYLGPVLPVGGHGLGFKCALISALSLSLEIEGLQRFNEEGALVDAAALARALVVNLRDLKGKSARDLAPALDQACHAGLALVDALGGALGDDRWGALVGSRSGEILIAKARAVAIANALARGRAALPFPVAQGQEPVRPAAAAARVHQITLGLLSEAARERFGDELLDELYDVAVHEKARRRHLACALRQLTTVRRLRAQARVSELIVD